MELETSFRQSTTFVKLRPLTTVDSSQLAASFAEMATALQGASFSGTARFTLVGQPQTQSFIVSVRAGSAELVSEAEKVDFEIITKPETWLAIAEGKIAPLDSFTRGKMRLRGDPTLGQRIMKRLAADTGRVDFC
ncbi:SCP2 sterol-binding domain-containing protein [Burkholderia ubonensis]|uniref:SCP2 sterol-binding domain-containing protein n=1 Tax=Burkholderia ubonensis TaxID=101571 RepID=UPI00075F3CA2|nr:SCP2 sterol-binding domain-containing protein [Burkholderia ubonensis]KWD26294.1 hypothetical protein WL60_29670 [Burkholderia ubonensis]